MSPAGTLSSLLAGGFAGALFTLSIPKADLELLAWICLLPCLYLISRNSRVDNSRSPSAPGAVRLGLLLGLPFGVISGLGRVYWISETLQNYGGLSQGEALLTSALMILYLSLYPICFFWACGRLGRYGHLYPWLAASVWVLLEWAQSWVISGFPWELLAYTQYLNRPLRQLASVTGVYGLSFLVVLVNVTIAQVICAPQQLVRSALPAIAILLAALVFGSARYEALKTEELNHHRTPGSLHPLRVGIVQGSVRQDRKWKPDRARKSTERYVELTRQLAERESLDLVILPETALPFYFNHPAYAPYRHIVEELVADIGIPTLVGSLELGPGERLQVYNRAILLGANGDQLGTSDKVHLVPFGEYLPMPWLFEYLEGLLAESGAFAPGLQHTVLDVPQTDARLGVFICFESVFPEISRTLVRQGASVLVNMTNDAWFGRTSSPYQHLSMAAMRAVETGRPLIRVANTGISGAVTPAGDILQDSELFETVTFAVTVRPRSATTFYVRYGDVFLTACALFLTAVLSRSPLPPEASSPAADAPS